MPALAAAVVPQTLELESTGSFTVGPSSDESCRCGPIGTTRTLSFRVLVTSCPEFLDANGFIVDWQDIHKYFRTRWASVDVFPSCERIAMHAVSDIVALIDGKALAVSVVVGSGAIPSGMTARWESPELGRRVTRKGRRASDR